MDIAKTLKAYYLKKFPDEAAKQLNEASIDLLSEQVQTYSSDTLKSTIRQVDPERLAELHAHLPLHQFIQFLKGVPTERISKILHHLTNKDKDDVIKELPKSTQKDLKELLKYPPGTAGHIMDPGVLKFRPSMTAQQAISKIKLKNKRGIRVLFLVNDLGELHSMVTIQQLVMANDQAQLNELAQPIPCILNDMSLQDEIVAQLEVHKMTDLPVVDIHRQFIGVVRHHSIIRATKEELTKDLQTMVGVSEDEKALSKVSFAVKKRLPWLEINLLTAFLAASVVSVFESTIAKYTALAVLLPVVAGQSGNTGAQALAITMRGLALKEIRTSHWLRLVFKEIRISLFTGVAVAFTTALGVFFWSRSLGLCVIIGISMILSMVLASIGGTLVPILLVRLGQDPASSSSILLTTITDVCGFLSFLGIATLFAHLI